MARGKAAGKPRASMGHRGTTSAVHDFRLLYESILDICRVLAPLLVPPPTDTLRQQLLAIWNRAKGKERDALLWGDEVRSNIAIT